MRKQHTLQPIRYRSGILLNDPGSAEIPTRSRSKRSKLTRKLLIICLLLVIVLAPWIATKHITDDGIYTSSATTVDKPSTVALNVCSGNSHAELIIVSIASQHLWACAFAKVAYSSPVVTGYSGLPADVTPIGNYQIFAKETDVNLTGTDGVTTWDDHVSYWMPFLFNQYGAYGLHDATWRTPAQFGNISPSSSNASHGCVELPLATAQWLYSWASVGTQVTIEQSA